MEYKGISSIVKEGEVIKSDRHTYTVKEILNMGLTNTYLAENEYSKEVIIKQFRHRGRKFIEKQREIYKFLKNIHKKDRDFSYYIEYVYEQFVFKGYLFEIKKKIYGENLEDYLYENALTFKERVDIAREISKIIFILHKNGLIHTDLKLEQFIKQKNIIKLIDFSNVIIPVKKIVMPAGTPGWKSPEHVKKEIITKKSDIFTLGLMVYTVLTGGYHPFYKSIENGTYERDILNITPPSLSSMSSKIPAEISDTLQRCFSLNQNDRPDAIELYRALNGFYPHLLYGDNKVFIYTPHFRFDSKNALRLFHNRLYASFVYSPHFSIHKKDGKYFIKHEKIPREENGKKYFRAKLNNRHFDYKELKDGDEIRIGKLAFMFKRGLL